MWIVELLGACLGLGLVWFFWTKYNRSSEKKKQTALEQEGVISIIDARHQGIVTKLEKLESKTHITMDTFIKVKDQLEQVEYGTVNLVLHTFGGQLSAAEAIARCILAARERGITINAFVAYYSCSAGCMIASVCNQIVMSETALLGPADAQQGNLFGSHSINAVCKTAEWKLATQRPWELESDWYSKYQDACATRTRQRNWIDELVVREIYSKDQGDLIYEELFSGKYNHDQVIHPQWAQRIGLPVVIKPMPDFVGAALKLANAKE